MIDRELKSRTIGNEGASAADRIEPRRKCQLTIELRVEALAAGKISNARIVCACRGNDALTEVESIVPTLVIGKAEVEHFHEIDQVVLPP